MIISVLVEFIFSYIPKSSMTTQINIHEYIKEYERLQPPRKAYNVPTDPSKKWWFSRSSNPETECVERCKYNLYQTALSESRYDQVTSKDLTHEQRVIHARYAALQSECLDACKSTSSQN